LAEKGARVDADERIISADMRSRLTTIGIIFSAWTALGLFTGGYEVFRLYLTGRPVNVGPGVNQLLYALVWAILTVFIFWFCERVPFTRSRVWIATAAHFGFFLVLSLAAACLMHLLRFKAPKEPSYHGSIIALRAIVAFCGNLWIYIPVAAVWHLIDYYQKFRDREVRAAQLQQQLATAQLELLKAQIHPHFLFNTLNCATAFMQDDPEAAEDMLADLAFLLRVSLRSGATQEISLQQEMDLLQAYLRIQKRRFEDRLEILLRVAPETLGAGIPTMLLQPLVENAIRHGIAPRAGKGRLQVHTAKQSGQLMIKVIDDGMGMSAGWRDGVGLSNTRGRLQQLYGDRHQLRFESLPGQGTTVTLLLPFRMCQENLLDDVYEDPHFGGGRRTAGAKTAAFVVKN
jgi:two-component system, LytTR family, sensor kinase